MRTPPSQADRDLIAALAEHDYHVTPTQLERWRRMGLIPRAVVQRDTFAGSRVAPHGESVLDACAVLAQVSGRGRPWQYAADILFDQECWLRDDALRETARFMVERSQGPLRRLWKRCEVGARMPGPDPRAAVSEVADLAATIAMRSLYRVVSLDVISAHPGHSPELIRKLTEHAIRWRLADIVVPEFLGEEERNLARHGGPEPLDPLSVAIALPSELSACIQTLTYAEANLARATLLADNGSTTDGGLLIPALWRVTAWRLDEHFARPDQPLPNERLQRIRDMYLTEAPPNQDSPVSEGTTGLPHGE